MTKNASLVFKNEKRRQPSNLLPNLKMLRKAVWTIRYKSIQRARIHDEEPMVDAFVDGMCHQYSGV